MLQTCRSMWFWCLWWIFTTLLLSKAQENPPSQPGFYWPLGSLSPVPCPKGTYGPTVGAVSIESCLKCPPHHHCPRPGLFAPLTCGPVAQQPLSGQDTCSCPGEGQSFQSSDGRCLCTLGYQPTSNGELCVQHLYGVCRDGKSRTQYGDCFNKQQWTFHCSHEVCSSAEDYRGYDRELGVCVCREPPGRAACGGLCRRKLEHGLQLQCSSDGDVEMKWSHEWSLSGSVLEALFKKWDSQGSLQCSGYHKSSRPVYIVQTTEEGFFGLLSGLPKEIQQLFEGDSQSSADKDSELFDVDTGVGNISHEMREFGFTEWREDDRNVLELSVSGVLNPTTCLHLGDILLFIVNTHHYPLYDLNNLYNTNTDFDWGAFRLLKEELTLSWTPPVFFSVVFSQPGVYVFTLSSNQHRHLYIRVMPAGGQCYEPGPFFPTTPRHLTRMGIRRRHDLLLQPDWLVTGGLLTGAVVILCLSVTVLILFREYGWPEKEPIKAKYRSLQLAYQMDDYSSKGSRVISLQKIHRKHQAGVTHDSIQPGGMTANSSHMHNSQS